MTMALLKTQPPDVLVTLREKESQTMAIIATEERTFKRLSAQLDPGVEFTTDPRPAILSRGQRVTIEGLRDESKQRLNAALKALEKIQQEKGPAQAARDARIRAEYAPKKRAGVLALRQAMIALMRANQNLVDIEDAEARALEVRSPSECGGSLALPGWVENPEGAETRVAMWERIQSIKAFLGE
jgi:NADH dehydrogenase/NADH:ubiquinone oxidoreductase subunit G